mgnify:CR=1 FL=1
MEDTLADDETDSEEETSENEIESAQEEEEFKSENLSESTIHEGHKSSYLQTDPSMQ